MNNFFHESPVTIIKQRNNANVTNDWRISLNVLEETIKGLKGLTIKSTTNDSIYYNSEEDAAESYPKSNPLIDNHTSDKKK